MKKNLYFMIIIILLSAFTFVSCTNDDTTVGDDNVTGSETDDSKISTDKPDSEVVVDIFQFKVEFKDAFEEVAEVYEQETGTKINIMTVGGGDDYGAALKAKFASGEEPAIFNVGGPQDIETWENYLYDLSNTEIAKESLSGTLDGVTKDNKVYAVPYNQEGYGLIYNKEILDKAEIDPNSLTTFEALEEAVVKLDSMKDELELDAVFAYPAAETWVTGLHTSNIYANGDFDNVIEAYEAKEIPFNYSDAFKKMVDLQSQYSVQPVNSLDYSMQVEELFSAKQSVVFIQQGNWVYNSIHDIDPSLAENGIGMIPLPIAGQGEAKLPVGIPNYWAVNNNKDDETIEEAINFLTWLYTSETGKDFVLNDFKFIPAYNGYDTSKISDPLSIAVYEWSESGETLQWVFMGYPVDWGMGVVGANLQKYFADEMTWDEFITACQNAWAEARE